MSDFEMTKAGDLVPFTPPLEWAEGEDSEAYRARLGFKRQRAGYMGQETLEHFAWYSRAEGKGHEFFVEWSDDDAVRVVFVPDWPTLLKLRALAATMMHVTELDVRLEELTNIASKAFRAWHGHRSDGHCQHCDPEEAKRDREMLARAQARNAEPCAPPLTPT